MKKHRSFLAVSTLLLASSAASAQSSVTLYGIVDAGFIYRSSERTGRPGAYSSHSTIGLASGNLSGSRWGLTGTEALGGSWSAIFTLENGFDITNGTSGQSGREFGRQAFVGLSHPNYGTLTLGRQYTSLDDLVGPVSAPGIIGGFGSHPGDIDDLDQTVRVDNSVKYTTAVYQGFSASALYGFGNQAGSMKRKNTWSVAGAYANGPLKAGVGYERSDNSKTGSTDPTLGTWNSSDDGTFASSISEGYASAQTQQIVAAGVSYNFGLAVAGLNYSNVEYKSGADSLFSGTATFNIVGAFAYWTLQPNLHILTGYSYTRGSHVDGIDDRAQYHSVSLAGLYDLSKRTTLYLLGGYQRALGTTLDVLGQQAPASASVGDKGNGHSSAARSQVLVSIGIRQKF